MSYSNKMDVIDLIISVLREHEGSLDTLVKRLEKIHLDLEEQYNDSNFKSESTGQQLKVEELEKKLERYIAVLRELMIHCESINDIVCLRTIAKEALEP